MAISWPFDSTLTQDEYGNPVYSRAYTSDVIARILARYFRNGVFSDPSTGMQTLQHEGMTVLVKSGAANINGRQFYEDTDRVLTVQAADASLDRIDSVVLRLSLEQSILAIDLYIVMGSPGAVPSAPELTRNASVWELGLANLFIAKGVTTVTQERITDTRLNSERCGVVASIIGDTDTSAYYTQLAALIAKAQGELSAALLAQQGDFDQWFEAVQQTLGEDVAGNLLNLINYHAPMDDSVSVPTSGWTGAGPYTQTVAVAGLLATDTPLVDISLSGTTAIALTQAEAYGYISKIVTGTDAITLTCLENKPEVDLTITLKVVR